MNNRNIASKFIIPGKLHDRHDSQYGHPGFGAHPVLRNTGFLKRNNPIKRTRDPRSIVINILVRLGFNNALGFINFIITKLVY